jgi:hypothetical protein
LASKLSRSFSARPSLPSAMRASSASGRYRATSTSPTPWASMCSASGETASQAAAGSPSESSRSPRAAARTMRGHDPDRVGDTRGARSVRASGCHVTSLCVDERAEREHPRPARLAIRERRLGFGLPSDGDRRVQVPDEDLEPHRPGRRA